MLLVRLSALPGTLVFNAPTGLALSADGKRKIAFGKKGLADIIGVCGGIAIAIEVKVGRDELSDDQQRFRRNWTRCGGVFIEARGVDECLAELGAEISRAELKMAERFARDEDCDGESPDE